MLNGTLYEQYAIQNKILDNNNDFIEKKTGSSKFSFAFIYQGNTYGVWNDFFEGKIFVSFDYNPRTPYLFSMTLKDHSPNTMLFGTLKRYNFWKLFLDNFKMRKCEVRKSED